MIKKVVLSKAAKKDLRKVPTYIALKLQGWVQDVEQSGLENVRKNPGWHDEPLSGKLKGESSIRLSRSYRAIYAIKKNTIEFVSIKEVTKHGY